MLHADWLSNAITVPYVPTIGPVHPDADIVELFQAVIDLKAGHFLPFDKDQRWSNHKDEIVLADEVEHRADRTAVTTLSHRCSGRVTVYHYAQTPPDLAGAREYAGKLAADHGAARSRVTWFQHEPPSAEVTLVRALLAPTRAPGRIPSRPILALQDATPVVRADFLRFAERAGDGMAYLGRCWAAGRIDTPVLVSTEQDRIVGAIGPMQTFPSPTAALQLLPQYFAGPAQLPQRRSRPSTVARDTTVGPPRRRLLPVAPSRCRKPCRGALPHRRGPLTRTGLHGRRIAARHDQPAPGAPGAVTLAVVEHRCFDRLWSDVSAGVASEEAVSMPRSAVPPWRERHRGSE